MAIAVRMMAGSIGWCDESGGGEEEDMVMVADNNQLKVVMAMEDTTVTATMTATATETAMAMAGWQRQQQSTTIGSKRNGSGDRGDNGGGGENGGNGVGNCGGSNGSCYSAQVKGRGDHCSNHRCQVSAATTTHSFVGGSITNKQY